MTADYRPTRTTWVRACCLMPSSYMATSHSSLSPLCSSSSSLVSICQFCHPSAFVFALPEASLFHFESLCLHLSPCIPSPSAPAPFCSICLSLETPQFIYLPLSHSLSETCMFFLPCCSGPTASTSLTTRARAALNSSSRPKS